MTRWATVGTEGRWRVLTRAFWIHNVIHAIYLDVGEGTVRLREPLDEVPLLDSDLTVGKDGLLQIRLPHWEQPQWVRVGEITSIERVDDLAWIIERLRPIAQKYGHSDTESLNFLFAPTNRFADERRPLDHLFEPDEVVRVATESWDFQASW